MTSIDLSLQNCEDEKIQYCESVQENMFLLGFLISSKKLAVRSANFDSLFSPNSPTLELTFSEIFENQSISEIDHMLNTHGRRALELQFCSTLIKPGVPSAVTSVVYRSDNLFIIEFDLHDQKHGVDDISDFGSVFPTIGSGNEIGEIANSICKSVAKFSGYDRVMVYQLDSQFNGRVIGEHMVSDKMESYHDLQFPANDIPKQARRLYELNWIRSIENVHGQSQPILPLREDSGREAVDLSYSVVRSVSPFHIQYLKNMGVKATLSISILKDNKLWGLIACHHNKPKVLPLRKRLELEGLGQLFGWQLVSKQNSDKELGVQSRSKALIDILSDYRQAPDVETIIDSNLPEILALMDACGVTVISDKSVKSFGTTPGKSAVLELSRLSGQAQPFREWHSHKISNLVDSDTDLRGCAGMLTVPMSRSHKFTVLWFRSDREKQVKWAGKESLTKRDAGSPDRLSPRGSFDLWTQTVQGESTEWSSVDIATAESFNKIVVSSIIERQALIQQQMEKFQELNEAKDHFLASISHELRSPLNAIMGWAELGLFDTTSTDKMIEALNVIKRAALTQADLINDLLDLSRIISGNMQLSVHTVKVEELVKESLQVYETALRSKGIELELRVEKELKLSADKVRFKQIITNLVSNAIKFSEKRGRLYIKARRDFSTVYISVKDEGKGISHENLARVFDRFYQTDKSHSSNGLGLGLAIVKQLVEMHGGEIIARSEGEGRGAEFEVAFPIGITSQGNGKPNVISDESLPKKNRLLDGISVLIAEDDQESRLFLKRFLENRGAQVNDVDNGQRAIDELRKFPDRYHLVVSDIGMPEMDGIEFIKTLRKSDESIRNIRCIALTAYAYSTDRVKALRAGFNAYVSKPLDGDELLTVMELELQQVKDNK